MSYYKSQIRKLFYYMPILVMAATDCVLPSEYCSAESNAYDIGMPMLIGGYGPGLYRSALHMKTGHVDLAEQAIELTNASFFVQHPTLPIIYCVCETDDGPSNSASVVALNYDSTTTNLTQISRQSTGGGGACYVSVDAHAEFVFVANYGGGSVAMFPLNADGSLQKLCFQDKHAGHSINPSRQTRPYAHCVVVDPTNQWLLSADLGTDQIIVYRIDRANKSLVMDKNLIVAMPPGSGPRHLVFHPTRAIYFVVNELNSTVIELAFDSASGVSTIQQTASTLPTDFDGENYPAEILIHPDGRTLYASNRGHNSIACFDISEPARLTLLEAVNCGGKTPRNFRIDPTGNWLCVANQASDTVCIFQINPQTGLIAEVHNALSVIRPACIKFLR